MRTKAQLMDAAAMGRALMHISHEIAEKNKGVDNVVLVGIRRRGEPIACQIRDNIEKIESTGQDLTEFSSDDFTHNWVDE